MTGRRKTVVAGAAVVGLAAVLLLPAVRWPLLGWWRGERFYDGYPTSYYAAQARAYQVSVTLTPGGAPDGYSCTRTPGPVDILLWQLRLRPPPWDQYSSFPREAAAVPMLVELLDASRREPAVRVQAAMALGSIRPLTPDAVAALRRAVEDGPCWAGTTYLPFVKDVLRRAERDAQEPGP